MSSSLPLNQIIPGDCIDVMAQLPEKSVDVIFADPPYFLQLQRDLYRPNLSRVNAVSDEWDKFSNFEEFDKFTTSWLSACRRILKDTGTIWVIGSYHSIFRVGTFMQNLGYWILNDIIWIKTNPMPNFRGVRFANAHETLIWAQKKKGARYTFNHGDAKSLNEDLQMRSDWTFPLTSSKERLKVNGSKVHPTQKPFSLLYRILLTSSNPGDVVLDPFFGTGTTGTVAKTLHRNWIGIEKEKKYVNAAQKRIEKAEPVSLDSLRCEGNARRKRIPFGHLIELGLLSPGQSLWADKNGFEAKILSNGKISCQGKVDSIHGMAKALTKTPANGWDFWYYKDTSGDLKSIDCLRILIREKYGYES